jgi:hypothetical protein
LACIVSHLSVPCHPYLSLPPYHLLLDCWDSVIIGLPIPLSFFNLQTLAKLILKKRYSDNYPPMWEINIVSLPRLQVPQKTILKSMHNLPLSTIFTIKNKYIGILGRQCQWRKHRFLDLPKYPHKKRQNK